MKNLKLLLIIAGFSAGIVATDSTEVYSDMEVSDFSVDMEAVNSLRSNTEVPQDEVVASVQNDTVKEVAFKKVQSLYTKLHNAFYVKDVVELSPQNDIPTEAVTDVVEVSSPSDDLPFMDKVKAFGKTLTGDDLQKFESLPKSDKDEFLKELYYKANPLTIAQKITGVTLFTTVVIGVVAYNYLYPPTDKDPKGDDKN